MYKYYLAYGSNLNKAQMMMRCPDAIPVGVGEIEGYELLYKGSMTGAYLTIERKAGSFVPVGIWRVSEADERRLDRYEGYPTFYYKTDVMMNEKKAFVYIMHEDRHEAIPSSFYVNTCKDGYKDFGFNQEILDKALEVTNERVSRQKKNTMVQSGKTGGYYGRNKRFTLETWMDAEDDE